MAMTVGFGMSIGTVNSVWAATDGDRDRPAVRVRRTAVTFDSAGGPRMGGLPRFAPVVTDFADLTRDSEPVVLGGRIWSPTDLVAAVVSCLIAANEPAAGPVATYPACYTARQLAALRHALDWSGAADVLLMPEPVAAVEWLDAEHGVSDNGLTLVYDLGGSCLDVAIVRTEADRNERGVLGAAVRSHDYGGRPLGTILARYARALAPSAPSPVSKVVPACDTKRLRVWNVRNSLRVVRNCVHAAGLTLREVDRVLVVGGAARPAEVAQVLAELGRPLVIGPDPAHTVAIGAAIASARLAESGGNSTRYARGAAVLSSAAVVSALAMSAATMLSNGPVRSDDTGMQFAPALADPANAARNHNRNLREIAYGVPGGADALISSSSSLRSHHTLAQSFSTVSAVGTGSPIRSYASGNRCDTVRPGSGPTYADPAQFINPLPFRAAPRGGQANTPTEPPRPGPIPSISLPDLADIAEPIAAPPPPIMGPIAVSAGTATSAPTGTPVPNQGTIANPVEAPPNPPMPAPAAPFDSTTTDPSTNIPTRGAIGGTETPSGTSGSGGSMDVSTSTGGPTSPGSLSGGSLSGGGTTSSGTFSGGGLPSGGTTGGSFSGGGMSGGTTSGGSLSGGGTTSGGAFSGGSTSSGTSSSSGGASGGGLGGSRL
ncbi:Hsp70 family protein [Nocardia transvalensis]|uniref:Hsp70 family protein n=1 Tax=Nocardia transvalensis TaxID=37333 RepID=UPI001896020E|nr:Hsp70 family protein [Nocardia transvalensis]MBF6331641.1 Hsp70 family protein [Nocardia transvalensis]